MTSPTLLVELLVGISHDKPYVISGVVGQVRQYSCDPPCNNNTRYKGFINHVVGLVLRVTAVVYSSVLP